jgi:hypothetical protein
MTLGPNRRIYRRKVLRAAVTVVLPGQPPRVGQSWDLGVDGMSLMLAKPLAPGTRCELSFDLPAPDGAGRVTARAKVLYCSFCGAQGFKVGTIFGALDEASHGAVQAFSR